MRRARVQEPLRLTPRRDWRAGARRDVGLGGAWEGKTWERGCGERQGPPPPGPASRKRTSVVRSILASPVRTRMPGRGSLCGTRGSGPPKSPLPAPQKGRATLRSRPNDRPWQRQSHVLRCFRPASFTHLPRLLSGVPRPSRSPTTPLLERTNQRVFPSLLCRAPAKKTEEI